MCAGAGSRGDGLARASASARRFAFSSTLRSTTSSREFVASFGGGGMHGYRSLEGTFLSGCLFSGRAAGRAAAAEA